VGLAAEEEEARVEESAAEAGRKATQVHDE
jgi:hypothetical protein